MRLGKRLDQSFAGVLVTMNTFLKGARTDASASGSKAPASRPLLARYGVAAGAVMLAVAVRAAFSPLWGPTLLPFVFFYPAIVFAAWYGRFRPALLSIVLSALAADWFFMEPLYSLALRHPGEVMALVSFVAVGLCITSAIEAMHRAKEHALAELDERKRAEASLRRNEENFRTLADHASMLIWVNSPTGCEYVNRPYLDFLGLTFEQVQGMQWSEYVHPEDREAYIGGYLQALEKRQVFEGQCRIRRASGEYRHLKSVGVPRFDSAGAFLGYFGCSVDITDRQQAEQEVVRLNRELQSKLDELQTILNIVPVGVDIAHDPECRRITHNLYISELLGSCAWENASLSAPVDEGAARYAVYQDGKELAPEEMPMRLACAGVDVRNFECDLVREGRPPIRLICFARPLRDAEGRIRGSVGASLDITARKQAEDELRLAEGRIRSVVDTVVDGIITIMENGAVETFNPAAERLFGYKAEEVAGQNVKMLMPEPYRHEHDNYIANYMRTGEAKIIGAGREVVGRRKDGSAFPMELAVSEFPLGGRRYFTGIVRDITERKRAEELLRESEERFRNMADNAPVMVWISGADKLCAFFNKPWLDFTGRAMEDELGNGWTEGVHPEDYDRCLEIYVTSFEARGPFKMEYRLRRYDGEHRWVLDHGVPQFSPCGDFLGYIGSCIDITERKQTEEALKEADRRKDEFLAMLAHELRNPLAPILNAAHAIKLVGLADVNQQWACDVIERQTQHLTRLVDDLLDVSRITQGKVTLAREQLELSTIIHRAIETSRPLIEARRHHLTIALPPGPVRLEGDQTRLVQVVGNLLNNAAKYTDEGGHIRLEAAQEDGAAVIRVRDDGMGMPAELLPHVFDLFTQADRSLDRSQGGLGIGLTLVRRLVEMHGGKVEARSQGAGRGSEFVVRLLALAPANAPDAELSSDGLARPVTHALRVLIVEDNIDSAEMMAFVLKLSGHEVQMAHNGPEALHAARAFEPHVVLCDIGLPGMNGYEVAARLREQPASRRALLIALTGYGEEEARLRAKEAGFDYHLVKPVKPDALDALLASLWTDQ
jgi:PAS domain S-box-containing protein